MQSQAIAKSVPGSGTTLVVRTEAPFALGAVLWRDESNRVRATVVAKATYSLAEGISSIIVPPEPIHHSNRYWTDPDPDADVALTPSDLAPFKPEYEIIVVGHAYGTGTHRAESARVVVGNFEKWIAVDNAGRSGRLVPLVGSGPLDRSMTNAGLRLKDRDWAKAPLRHPLPEGFDERYFCTAPEDQRSASALRADELLILDGLHPSHAHLITTLAGLRPSLRSSPRREELPSFIADTLYIDTDRQIATLAFRAIVFLKDGNTILDVVAEREPTPTEGADEPTAEKLVESRPEERSVESKLEFGSGDTPSPIPLSPIPFPPPRGKGEQRGFGDDATMELDRRKLDLPPAGLPFSSAPNSEPDRARMASTRDSALPFRALPQQSPPVHAPPPLPRRPEPPLPPPSPPRATFGQLQSPLPPPPSEQRTATEPPPAPVAASKPSVHLERSPAIAPLAPATLAARQALPAALSRRAMVDLLAFDPGVPNRLRRSKAHAPTLAKQANARGPWKVDAEAPVEQDPDERARRDVLRVLSCGTPLYAEQLEIAFDALLDDPHDFELPLFVVEGDVRPTMDEVETLRVAVGVAKPIAGNSKRVQTAVAAAEAALARSAPPLSDTAAALYKQLESSTSELSLSPKTFADQVDRALLDARSYKKRTLSDSPRIRADLTFGRSTMPIYLPEAAGTKLPLLPVFPLVALVELRPREDASESNPAALVAFAIGRVLRTRK